MIVNILLTKYVTELCTQAYYVITFYSCTMAQQGTTRSTNSSRPLSSFMQCKYRDKY